jgi:poly-beta-1,6-N-acetyl-D-glucosamine synthase
MTAIIFWLCLLVILYVYALYPAILWVLACLFPAPDVINDEESNAYLPEVTLLVSAYLEEAVINQKLENCLSLNYPPELLQILVAVDGNEDHTREIVESFANRGVELSYSSQRVGKINAINRAIQAARGEIIVLTDANTFFTPDALQRLVAPLKHSEVGAVSGAKSIIKHGDSLANSEGLYWKYESFIKKQETRLGSCTGVSGEIFAFRRSLFQQPPPSIINDDFYLAMSILRKGFRVVYAPGALAYENASSFASDETIRRSRIIAGRYQALWMGPHLLPFNRPVLAWQVISHKFLRPLIPFAMLGAFIANLLAVIMPVENIYSPFLQLAAPFGLFFLIGQILFYGIAWLGNYLQVNHSLSSIGKILYLPAFLVNSNLSAVTGLILFITRRQTNLWQRVERRNN